MNKKLPRITLALLTLWIASCSGVMDSSQPEKHYYMLMPLAGAAETADPGPELFLSLDTIPGLDTDRIQAIGTDARLHRYANARWPDNLPEVLSSVIRRSMMSSGNFSSVEEASRAGNGGWFLELEVQRFFGIQNSAGVTTSVAVEINGSISCGDERNAFSLSESVSVATERVSAIVSAHQKGLNDVSRQLLEKIGRDCG